ncbi:hypothetical protein [Ehrlichia japonica]|uniref:Uncharacterized protein n=1 Tax=Ehrlichia japonica TaxID=391036 RepID=X5H1K2_9RICK|nr:hypothetical protein [Ehrlichia japonica]AHX04729.1 hypothetical protein EHF_0758 [Ehrlichia japonica]
MTYNSTIKISALVSLLLIFITLLAFALLKYLQQRQQLTAPSAAAPFNSNIKIKLPVEKLTQLMCGFSDKQPDVDAIKGNIMSPDRDLRKVQYLKCNNTITKLTRLFKDHAKLSEIVKNPTLEASDQSLTKANKKILKSARKHIKRIETTLNTKEGCNSLFHIRATTAAILENMFNKYNTSIPNTNIIHELVSYCNPAGYYSMPIKFLKEVFEKCEEIDMNKTITGDKSIVFQEVATTRELTCNIVVTAIIPYKGKNEQITSALRFTITSPDSQNFLPVCYKDINLTIRLPEAITEYITSLYNVNAKPRNSVAIYKYIPTNIDNNMLTYSFPDFYMPRLINIENICYIVEDAATPRATPLNRNAAPYAATPRATSLNRNAALSAATPLNRNAALSAATPHATSPDRNAAPSAATPRATSPYRNAAPSAAATPRATSPDRNAAPSAATPRATSPYRNAAPSAATPRATSPDRNAAPFNSNIKIKLSEEKLTQLMCGFSDKQPDVDAIKGNIMSPDRDFREGKYLKCNDTIIPLARLFKDHAKLSEIVKNPTLEASDQSLTADDKRILDSASQHIKRIETTLNTKEGCNSLLHIRATTAAILENMFNKCNTSIPNTNIIHELVSYCNPAGYYSMPIKFLKEVFEKCEEIDVNKTITRTKLIVFQEVATTTELTCNIDVTAIIPYKGKNEKITSALRFTITSPDSQNFLPVCYKDINLTIRLPEAITEYITSLYNVNAKPRDSVAIYKYIPTNIDNDMLIYSFPDLQMPRLINIENICYIVEDAIPRAAPLNRNAAPSAAATPRATSPDRNAAPSAAATPRATSPDRNAAPFNSNIMSHDRDFRKVQHFQCNDTTIELTRLFKDHAKLSEIVKNPTLEASDQSLTTDDKRILDSARQHIKRIETTLNTKEGCNSLFHIRATTAAILENMFNKYNTSIPNTNIIHELVSHCNPAGYYSMPIKFLKEVFGERKEINMNKTIIGSKSIVFQKVATTTELKCIIVVHAIIPYKGKNEEITYALRFTITSPDSQNFLPVCCYKDINLTIRLPEALIKYITSVTYKRIPTNIDDNRLIYSFPDFHMPSFIDIQNFDAVVPSDISMNSYLNTIQPHR